MKFIREYYNNNIFPDYQDDLDELKSFIVDLEDESYKINYKSASFSKDCTYVKKQEIFGKFYDFSSWSDWMYSYRSKKDGWGDDDGKIYAGFMIDVFTKINIDSNPEEIYNEAKLIFEFQSRLKSKFSSGTFINRLKNLGKYTFQIHTSTIDGVWKVWHPELQKITPF